MLDNKIAFDLVEKCIIHSFCCLSNECMFCTCKQHKDRILDLQRVYFRSYFLFGLFIFLSFWMVFPPMSCFSLLLLWKAIIGSIEKNWALFVFLVKNLYMDLSYKIGWFLRTRVKLRSNWVISFLKMGRVT